VNRRSPAVAPVSDRRPPALALLAIALVACAPDRAERVEPRAAAQPASLNVVVAERVWTFESRAHRAIETPSYQVLTTEPGGVVVDRLPAFLELALNHYTTTLAPLPRPTRRMETYLLSSRPQWTRVTQRIMGHAAQPYLMIQRGGFAAGGKGVFWNIGPQDTFAIASHEGWHQFTQASFREPLPIWLEEGLATYMEGFRWGGPGDDRPVFLPWANLERFDTLRAAAQDRSEKSLRPLAEVVTALPQDLVQHAGDPALVWYAQVWALAHFLAEGEAGRHRPALVRLLRDAAQGRLGAALRASLGDRAGHSALGRRVGPEVLLVYVDHDLDRLDAQYRDFIARVTAVGARDRVVQGHSPLH